MKHYLITGVSSGIGYELAEQALNAGCLVTGLSRRQPEALCKHENFRWMPCDLSAGKVDQSALQELLHDRIQIDTLVLNAGMCPPIQSFTDESLSDIERLMRVNVWGNKILVEALAACGATIDLAVAISSGAAVGAYKGMGSYAISKAALNAMVQLWSQEYPHTHWIALAPGVIETAMQDVICGSSPSGDFPILEKLQAARAAGAMWSPKQSAQFILEAMPQLAQRPNGSFQDLREMI